MKIKKGTSWLVGIIILTGPYIFTAFVVPGALAEIGTIIVLAIAFATVGYQAANVADNWQRSVNYRPELDDRIINDNKEEQCAENHTMD